MYSNIIYENVFPVSSSVTDATVTVITSANTTYTITITCTIHPDSDANVCELLATANGQTLTGNECEHIICT